MQNTTAGQQWIRSTLRWILTRCLGCRKTYATVNVAHHWWMMKFIHQVQVEHSSMSSFITQGLDESKFLTITWKTGWMIHSQVYHNFSPTRHHSFSTVVTAKESNRYKNFPRMKASPSSWGTGSKFDLNMEIRFEYGHCTEMWSK